MENINISIRKSCKYKEKTNKKMLKKNNEDMNKILIILFKLTIKNENVNLNLNS